MKNVIASFARNIVFANILLVLIFLAGGFAVKYMVRENFPEFTLDMITITVPFPGADPEEVEEGINRKIEEALEGVEGIKLLTTYSSENSGTALVEVKEGYDGEKVLDRTRTKVDAISTFPVDAEKPIITELVTKDPVMLMYLSGNMSERRIKEWSERIKDEIQQLEGISQVAVFGAREYEIAIEVSEQRLREYGLSFSTVADAVRRSNLNLAGGTIRTTGEEIRVRTLGRKYTGEELASIVVIASPGGEIITLDRIADIHDGFTEDPIQAIINGEQAVLIIVYKTSEEDSLAISDISQKFIAKKQQQLPAGLNLNVLYDNTEMLRARINLLVKNGTIGLCIVFLLLWIFLNARLSFWSGMGIPISLAGAMAILWGMGATINLISLFGLIMVLGIVVDDAIVVGEAIYVHRKMGKPPVKAAVDGVSEVGLPVIAAVITTMVAFIPLAYVAGIMGKFIAILPVVVIACLAVSLVECLILLPAHLSTLPDPSRSNNSVNALTRRVETFHHLTSSGMEWFVEKVYKPFLSKALNWRYVSLCTAIAILFITLGLVNSGIVKFEVMPKIDGFIMTATAEFPNGTPPEITSQAIDQIDAALLRLAEKTTTMSGAPLIKDRLAIVGQTLGEIPDFGPNYGAVQAILLESENRGIHSKDLMVKWEEEIGLISGIKSLTFEGMAMGPPGAPIEVWIQGYDMDDILAASEDLMQRLRQFEGVYQIRSDFAPGKNEIQLSLKPEARTLGLTVDDLARQIYTGYYGEEALRLQRGRDDVKVKVRYTANERNRISDFEKTRIRTRSGHKIPLTSVANIDYSPGYSTIIRSNGMRRVAVSAGLDTNKANANEIIGELKATYFGKLIDRYPGLIITLQGEQKRMRESFGSLYVGFPLAVIGIFIIIATMFRSYTQPFIILFTVPFGIIGAVFGHLVFGYDLAMMSVFGMVALTGVVVNDAIVLIERINENIAEGQPFFEAILNGGSRRFRAITLTSLSTIGGLMPLILEKDLQARFLIPMALSLAAGVLFATVLTLVLIPSLLTILNDLRLLVHRLRRGVWPKRVAVEPARDRHQDPLKMPLKPTRMEPEVNATAGSKA
ncbi:MAG: efflux RND transporter permease subunit [Thermodesulfobacteriota bacterium]